MKRFSRTLNHVNKARIKSSQHCLQFIFKNYCEQPQLAVTSLLLPWPIDTMDFLTTRSKLQTQHCENRRNPAAALKRADRFPSLVLVAELDQTPGGRATVPNQMHSSLFHQSHYTYSAAIAYLASVAAEANSTP
jgi:hypothetical protein